MLDRVGDEREIAAKRKAVPTVPAQPDTDPVDTGSVQPRELIGLRSG
jgi:hypothetical protein